MTLAGSGGGRLPFWLASVFILQFFRDPPREIAGRAGRGALAGRRPHRGGRAAHDPYLERDALKISVFMNVFNVHSNRSPVDGDGARARGITRGAFVNAALDKASLDNERNALWIAARRRRTTSPACRSPGLIARRILCYVKPGDALARGQRYGFIRFGSRVDLYLPPDAQRRRPRRRQGVRQRRPSSPS